MESLQILGQELKTLRGALFTTKLQLREAEKEAKMMREKAEEARSAIDLSLSIFCLIEQLLPQSGLKTLGSTDVVKTKRDACSVIFTHTQNIYVPFTKYLTSLSYLNRRTWYKETTLNCVESCVFVVPIN